MKSNPKYTIIIPAKNSFTYIKDCIQSVITQDFTDYELIVSDNEPLNNTFDYVTSLNHPNIRLLKNEEQLSMVDHFEWALSHATGQWVIILGADDGVMPYFFKLAEFLTKKADEKNIKAINSAISFFIWNGCQAVYGDTAIDYNAKAFYSIKNSKFEILNALIGNKYYINLPYMYATSLVHKSVIEEAKQKQNGMFYAAQTPDACSAAIICSIENEYIESAIPLGWSGASPSSNGLKYSKNKKEYQAEYFKNMSSKVIKWNELVGKWNPIDGDRTVDNFRAYFFEALLQTHRLQSSLWKNIYNSKLLKTILFAALHLEIQQNSKNKDEQIEFLKEISETNKISFKSVLWVEKNILPLVKKFFIKMQKISNKYTGLNNAQRLHCNKKWEEGLEMGLMDASNIINKLDEENEFVSRFISV